MGNYWGMNRGAAEQIKGKHMTPKSDNIIYVSDKLKGQRLKRIVAHEKIELYMIRHKGLNYKQAHRIAEKWEKNVK